MKESKIFFDDNRLNKGCKKTFHRRQHDDNASPAKYSHVLPPLDMVEQYEESYPGTFEKLFNMAKKEQDHRHAMELISFKKHNNAANLGRIVVLILLTITFISAAVLFIVSGIKEAVVFSIFPVACVAVVAYFSSKNSIRSTRVVHNNSRVAHNNSGVVHNQSRNRSRYNKNRNFASKSAN